MAIHLIGGRLTEVVLCQPGNVTLLYHGSCRLNVFLCPGMNIVILMGHSYCKFNKTKQIKAVLSFSNLISCTHATC